MNNIDNENNTQVPTLEEAIQQLGEIKGYLIFLRAIFPEQHKKRFNKILHQFTYLLNAARNQNGQQNIR